MIISSEGHILTNAHVIYGDYESENNSIFLHDYTEADAEVIGYDLDSDIALLKIEVEGPVPAARIGDSSKLRTGEPVLAIGHPEGYYYSLSTGVISSLEHFGLGPNVAQAACSIPWIQTDAAINEGNSGGPLLNDDGEIIGIISWGFDFGDDSGLNFAVPINEAMFIQEFLRDERYGYVPWGVLGVYAEWVDVGYEVIRVNEGSGAEAAGILPGDLIIEYNNEPFFGVFFACELVGKEIPIKLIRDGEELILSATLGPFEGEGRLL